MAHERTGLVNIPQHFIDEAMKKLEQNPLFVHGCRVLFLIQRHSDGGHTNNSKLRHYISRNAEEWILCYAKLLQEMSFYPDIPLRIYQTINSRNIDKGIKQFKHAALEADYYDKDMRQWFYIDVKNRMVSSLMKRGNKETSYFLYDCDTSDDDVIHMFKTQLECYTRIITMYRSKSGWHIITDPFNHTKVVPPTDISLNVDGMMLLKWQ